MADLLTTKTLTALLLLIDRKSRFLDVPSQECGFRNGYGWVPEGDSPVVLFVGDSTIFYDEVNDEETGPSDVAKLLGPDWGVRVLNAGCRGYNTLQSKRMLLECLERFPSTVVVVYVYCANDNAHSLLALVTPATRVLT